MILTRASLALLVIAGHCALWITVFNRMNAWRYQWARSVEKAVFLGLGAPFIWMLWCLSQGAIVDVLVDPPAWSVTYGLACGVALAWKVPTWVAQRISQRELPVAVLAYDSRRVDVAQQLGRSLMAGMGKVWGLFPGNESAELMIEQKTLWTPSMPRRLSGLTVTHLSDLHFTGMVAREYFERVVDEANALQSDMIFLTGDIVDRRECLEWVAPLLGRLEAPFGVYFILGNHDERPGGELVRASLVDAGLISLGSRSMVINYHGTPILLAGDERPWFGAEPPLPQWSQAALRLLLAHTPDRYAWAKERGFDTVFAGHTHGGQVQLPLIGPIFSPSMHGTRYASGVFDEPSTVMHVSRGVSGLQPLRWRCPPELTQLTLATDLEALLEKRSSQEVRRDRAKHATANTKSPQGANGNGAANGVPEREPANV